MVDGLVRLPDAPGIGIDLPADLVNHFLVGADQNWEYHDIQS